MNLRKRAISGIMLAGSMVVMCAIADAASTVSAEAVAVVADTRTDLATDGTVKPDKHRYSGDGSSRD